MGVSPWSARSDSRHWRRSLAAACLNARADLYPRPPAFFGRVLLYPAGTGGACRSDDCDRMRICAPAEPSKYQRLIERISLSGATLISATQRRDAPKSVFAWEINHPFAI